MLNSKDKIFTNLYGQESFALQMAYARGDWDNTKELMAKGADWIIDEVKKLSITWTWWCRFSNWLKVVLYAKRSRKNKLSCR
jgi:NADH-quinone oxidoreductase subunit F